MLIPWNNFRASIIALLFTLLNPELLAFQTLINEPMQVAKLIILYVLSVFAFEIYYRVIVWGQLNPVRQTPVVFPPKLCCNPWKSFLDHLPDLDLECEVFCINGLTIPAMLSINEEGGLEIILQSEYKGELQMYEPYDLKPTHWRIPTMKFQQGESL